MQLPWIRSDLTQIFPISRCTPCPPPCCAAVTDSASNRVIPPIDPAFPDPLNTVNTTVINVPNARAEGELG